MVVVGGSSSKKSKGGDRELSVSSSVQAAEGESSEATRVFGVPLEVAVARSKCHDGLRLPLAVRMCVDHIEEHGLMIEGVYRYTHSEIQGIY